MVAGDLREEGVGSCLVDTELVGSGEWRSLEMDGGDGCTAMWVYFKLYT